jgi:hypothetical protein
MRRCTRIASMIALFGCSYLGSAEAAESRGADPPGQDDCAECEQEETCLDGEDDPSDVFDLAEEAAMRDDPHGAFGGD